MRLLSRDTGQPRALAPPLAEQPRPLADELANTYENKYSLAKVEDGCPPTEGPNALVFAVRLNKDSKNCQKYLLLITSTFRTRLQ